MTTSNIKDAGWFCHAPNKQRTHDEMPLPPTSQIPGLSEFPPGYPPADEPKKMLIKDTDTKYIALCKMGGRSDLLRIASPKARPTEPKPYRTVDWYYIEDIRKEEAEKKDRQPHEDDHYQTMLPEYMIHKEYAPYGNQSQHKASRNPLSRDTTTVFQREGNSATNKTVKIEEPRPKGYGVREEKYKGKKVSNMPPMPKYERAKGREAEIDGGKQYAKPMKLPKEEDRPLMSKILSFGYQQDWAEAHDDWQRQEELRQQQYASVIHPGKTEKTQSEYQSQMLNSRKQSTDGRVASHGRRAPSGGSSASHRRTRAPAESQQPDFFSLPRYDSATQKQEDIQPMSYDPIRQLSSVEGKKRE